MRNVFVAIAIVFLTLAVGLTFALVVLGSQPDPSHQLKNGYWPFTVELSVQDR